MEDLDTVNSSYKGKSIACINAEQSFGKLVMRTEECVDLAIEVKDSSADNTIDKTQVGAIAINRPKNLGYGSPIAEIPILVKPITQFTIQSEENAVPTCRRFGIILLTKVTSSMAQTTLHLKYNLPVHNIDEKLKADTCCLL